MKGQTFNVQYNYCSNPFCESFSLPQERFEKAKNKPYRYKLHGSKNRRTKAFLCNELPIVTKIPKAVLACSNVGLSNWAIAEEIKRLVELQTVVEIEPEYDFHKRRL